MDVKDELLDFIRTAYATTFTEYEIEWKLLRSRVERCEREAKVATQSLELLKLSLEALAGIRRHEEDPNQFQLPGIIDRE